MRRRDTRSAHTCETLCEMSSGMSFVYTQLNRFGVRSGWQREWRRVCVAEGVAKEG